MQDKIFILGVGAQKCGTTWIQDFVSSYTCADFGFTKEYHFFDSLNLKECECFFDIVYNDVRKELENTPSLKSIQNSSAAQKLAFYANPSLYYAYFTNLLSQDGISITGDFTPSYSGLSADVFIDIKRQFNSRGIRVVPVFLMRDPVQRLQSMARMSLRRLGNEPNYQKEIAKIKALHLSKQDVVRSNYPDTIMAIESVFGEDMFVGFYESIFTTSEVRRLCGLLNIKYKRPDFDKKLNVNKTKNDLPESIEIELRKGYQKIYSFCEARYGKELVDELWFQRAA